MQRFLRIYFVYFYEFLSFVGFYTNVNCWYNSWGQTHIDKIFISMQNLKIWRCGWHRIANQWSLRNQQLINKILWENAQLFKWLYSEIKPPNFCKSVLNDYFDIQIALNFKNWLLSDFSILRNQTQVILNKFENIYTYNTLCLLKLI
jgi:hypothetical protein